MRVCAGIYKHRILKTTNLDTTRETQDKVKQAIFNMIGPYFYDKKGLDLFCGSGSLGIECLSRGMDYVLFNDLNKKAQQITIENIENLKIEKEKYDVYNKDYIECLKTSKYKFDYIFLDPPYNFDNINEILDNIVNYEILEEKSIVIFEMSKMTKVEDFKNLKIIKEKIYGIKKVVIFKYESM